MYMLDDTKISIYKERLKDWEEGKRISPITVDMALTRNCNFKCKYCYSNLQDNIGDTIGLNHIDQLVEDFKELDVKGISLISDGESTIHPQWAYMTRSIAKAGRDVAIGTNGLIMGNYADLKGILECLTYVRINISAGTPQGYQNIMGMPLSVYQSVLDGIRRMVSIKRQFNLKVTIGLQMVLQPSYLNEVIPLCVLGRTLGVDYLVIKHCSDSELGELGVNYDEYLTPLVRTTLEEAEGYSNENYAVKVKWSKINCGNRRPYTQCYGMPFFLQISGSGLVAPCGFLFNDRYKENYHVGNITKQRFRDIVRGERYWDVVKRLSSDKFNANTMCGTLCAQHNLNVALDKHIKGEINIHEQNIDENIQHRSFL